jgi:hypothetical protein
MESMPRRVVNFLRRRRTLAILGALYLVTGLYGIPLVRADVRNRAAAAHASFLESEKYTGKDLDSFPKPITRVFSFPLLPGFIFSSEGISVAKLCGEGHWAFYWVGWSSPIEIFEIQTWIS